MHYFEYPSIIIVIEAWTFESTIWSALNFWEYSFLQPSLDWLAWAREEGRYMYPVPVHSCSGIQP
eukprot:SAG11_NODE_1707_length_4410_cov_12.577824_3_plen_65_part_00